MQVAMSAVAADILGMAADGWRQLLRRTQPLQVDARFIARGLFEATIYTSHMQQTLLWKKTPPQLRRRFSKALCVSKDLAKGMKEYVRMRHGAVVTELSREAHSIVASANSLLDFGILQWIHGVDSQTIEAICGALDDAGHDGQALLKHYQQYDKGRLKEGIDLSDPRYLKYFGRDGLVDWDPERGTYRTQPFLRSYWPQLPFVFVAEAGMALECRLTCRLPHIDQEERHGPVRINVNGKLVATISASTRWSQQRFMVDAAFVKDGFNDILLEWPEIPNQDDTAISLAIRRLQVYGQANWFPIFGEVFSFRINTSPIPAKPTST